MTKAVMLDSGVLGRIAHPQASPSVIAWLRDRLAAGIRVIIPEIADYEVRRSFLLSGLIEALESLDQLKGALDYAPLTTEAMLRAAEFWALSRRQHRPTCDPRELDADAILGAQATIAGAEVATDNVGHLSLFVQARNWEDVR